MSTSEGSFRLIDRFSFTVNNSNFQIPLSLVGDFGVATALLSYQLKCDNLSVCEPTPTETVVGSKECYNVVLIYPLEQVSVHICLVLYCLLSYNVHVVPYMYI